MKKTKYCITLTLLLLSQVAIIAQQSKLVYPGNNGKLVYAPYTDKNDIIPDFSYCGYKGGGVAIPYLQVVTTLKPGDFTSDDTPRIQEAVDQLAKKSPDKNGFRGAILLKKGKYRIENRLLINASGIVLRGEGEDDTQLIVTPLKAISFIQVGESIKPEKENGSEQKITNQYVPSGSRKITVKDASRFRVGDEVIVERPSTKEWISAIGMDKIPPYWQSAKNLSKKEKEQYRKEGRLNEDETQYYPTVQWEPGSRNLFFERVITAINGNEISLDIPLTNAFQQEFGGGSIYRYKFTNRPSEIGLESFSVISEFDSTKVSMYNNKEYFSDEKHLNNAITYRACQNVWAKNVTLKHVSNYGFRSTPWTKYMTIEDCKVLDPVSIISGGRRYSFNLGGQMGLVQRCFTNKGRHDYVQGAGVPGPNAFVDSEATECYACSEPHHRWSVGTLFDNIKLSGPSAYLNMANRGNSGTGHGWTCAQAVAWNCKAPFIVVMQPPTGQNFVIGTYGILPGSNFNEKIDQRIEYTKEKYGIEFEYKGGPVIGNGYIESPEQYVTPQFLYYKQLWDRLGESAVRQVTTPAQQAIIFAQKYK